MDWIWRWAFGLIFSVGVGHLFLKHGLPWLRCRVTGEPKLGDDPGISASWWGFLERPFFTIATAFSIAVAVPSMLAWIGLKMTVIWGHEKKTLERKWLPFPSTSLYGNFVSMLFALIGGLICNGTLWFPTQ